MALLVLGIESSCDATGVALVRTREGAVPELLGQALHSQIAMHADYGGVVPELASRDHIRRIIPLANQALAQAGQALAAIDVVAYTRGPGLAGALLVGAGVACALGAALRKPVLGVHHLEGHLLSPFLSADPPEFPFVALLVSGGHTQLLRVDGEGQPQPVAFPEGIEPGQIHGLYDDADTLLVASVNGAWQVRDGKATPWGQAQGFAGKQVRQISRDGDGGWLVACSDGVWHWQADGRLRQLLASNRVSLVLGDSHKAVWIVSNDS